MVVGIDGRDEILQVALLLEDVEAADAEDEAADEEQQHQDAGDRPAADRSVLGLR